MRMAYIALFSVVFSVAATAQSAQLNGINSALNVNDTALNAFLNQGANPPPLQVSTLTDSPLQVNLRGTAQTPVVIVWAGSTNGSSAQIAAFSGANVQLDVRDQGVVGYSDQTIVDGYGAPWPTSFTDAGGNFSLTTVFPACVASGGTTSCITAPNFDVTIQGLVTGVNPPFNVLSTGAVTGNFINGYEEFNFSGSADDQFSLYTFKDGFNFNFYGVNYTQVYVSENSYIQFGSTAGLSTFPNPTVGFVNSGGPRIMTFFNDLDPDSSGNNYTVFVQQFEENGVKKARFVHEQIQEFGAATGGHGGEITLTENDEIAVFVASYNASPSINTAVGISKGGHPTSSFQSAAFGRNLSADIGFNVVLGNNVPGFELFDEGNTNPSNPLDLIGVNQFNGSGVGPGIVYTPDPNLTFPQAGYIIQ
jgi:hypothetical protein